MIDLKGLAFLGFTGMGALFGGVLALPVLAAGVVFPAALGWVWAPLAGGVVIGAIVGAIVEMRP